MATTLIYIRRWNGTDAIARDWRGNKTKRAIYRFEWPTGHELLVFHDEQDARTFARLESAEFIGEQA